MVTRANEMLKGWHCTQCRTAFNLSLKQVKRLNMKLLAVAMCVCVLFGVIIGAIAGSGNSSSGVLNGQLPNCTELNENVTSVPFNLSEVDFGPYSLDD